MNIAAFCDRHSRPTQGRVGVRSIRGTPWFVCAWSWRFSILSGSLLGRSLNAFSVRPAARSSRVKILFRLLLCGIPHEHRTLRVLPLISPDIRIRFWQQGKQPFPKRLAPKIPPPSQVDCRDFPSGVLAPQKRANSSCTLSSRRSKNPRRPAALSFKPKEGMPFQRAPISGVCAGCKDTPRSGCSSNSPAAFCCFFHLLFRPGRDFK